MSKQIACWKLNSNFGNGSTEYVDPFAAASEPNAAEFRASRIMTAAGVISNLKMIQSVAPGAGNSWTYTVRKNGAATTLTCQVAELNTEASDVLHTVSVAVGDVIALECTPASLPTVGGVRCSLDFDSTTSGESQYGGSSINVIAAARQNGLFFGNNFGNWAGSATAEVCPLDGTITRLYVELDGDPTPATYTFGIYKNGTFQNGGGGTPDTRVAIAPGATSGNSSFTLDIAPGDILYLDCIITGVPGATRRARYGFNVIADIPGFSIYGCYPSTVLNNSDVQQYWRPEGCKSQASDATEANVSTTIGVSGFTLRNMYAVLTGTPGAGNSYNFTVHKNGAPTALAVSIADLLTAGNDVADAIAYVAGDTLSVGQLSVSAPSLRSGGWMIVQDARQYEPGAGGGTRGRRLLGALGKPAPSAGGPFG